ncbi:gliding motility lipoprotein GldD [Flagellimonas lutaonensis]|uniref:Gliding motility-associated lipoprotein GldD n=1 Tax=Flagellimonas lutaonensis TaxID=516051 RepID=A0A0D5YSD4_9FLAO|nr:gliding motility lipoprotein GldD [Allomuricauda lutaonensis]AKA34771.1 Gliding motility-associated lipoprotein GldD [Allomuricauda lutaonensis]
MKNSVFIFFLIILVCIGCGGEEVLPRPKAMLRLTFPAPEYSKWNDGCAYTFMANTLSEPEKKEECSMVLNYPMMKASVFITYKKVNNNLATLLRDAQKLSYEHVVKADNIIEQPYINEQKRVYGMFYEVTGNAASQSQFYATDSLRHFVTGSLYFYAKPNYDSIYPAAIYLQKDIRRILETLEWDND